MKVEDIIMDATKKRENSFGAISLEDSLEKTMDKIIEAESKSTAIHINDQYTNELTATGQADRVKSFTNYGFVNDTLNWPLWLALYNDSWVFRRAIDKPAQDIINVGFSISGDEDYTKVYRAYEKYKSELTNLLMWGALFGGSVAVMMFDTVKDEDMAKPLKKSLIKGAKMKLYVTDRWYGCSEVNTDTVTNMKDIDFGKPKMYHITFADGRGLDVHHSYILRYEHRTAPRLVKNGQLQGWGYCEGAHILNELSRDDQIKSAITSLINKCLIEVIKMAGMRGIFMGTDKKNEEQLRKRLEMVNWARSFNSLTFLDKDDDYQMQGFQGLSGLSDLLNTNMKLIGAALEMPGILFGDLDGGFSADIQAMTRYSITIKNRADTYFRPVLYKFLKILFIMYDIEGSVNFEFNSLTQIDDNNKKVESIQKFGQVMNEFVNNGIISRYQMALSLKDFIQKGAINIQFSEEQLNKLKLEEEIDILKTYEKAGKKVPDANDGGNSLGGGLDLGGSDLNNDLGGDFLEENDLTAESPAPEVEETPPSEAGGDIGE